MATYPAAIPTLGTVVGSSTTFTLTTLSFDNAHHILDSGNHLAVFVAGCKLAVSGSASNNGIFTVTVSTAGQLTVTEVTATEGAGASMTIKGADYPKAADNNTPNAEIVAAATEFGVNPQIIDDTVAPGASPASVAEALDMFANILKNQAGASAWTNAAVPARQVFFGNGGGQQVPAYGAGGNNYYVNLNGYGLNANADNSGGVSTYPLQVIVQSFWVELLTAQPSDFTMQFFGVGGSFIIQPSQAAGIYRWGFQGSAGLAQVPSVLTTPYAGGNQILLQVVNSSASSSAQIGAWSLTMMQVE